MSEPDVKVVGTAEKSGVTYQAEVERTDSTRTRYLWRVWRLNVPGTPPIRSVVAQGTAQSPQEAERQALAALKTVTAG